MTSGSCSRFDQLPSAHREVLHGESRAVLGTIDDDGRPHLVPITFAVVGRELISAVDHKPKSTTRLARLRNIERSGTATALIDRYDEDWGRLLWIMVRGSALIEPPGYNVDALVARYSQYRDRPPQGPVAVVTPKRIDYWSAR
jgi:PPOX class probable F420-dependent enzyme